MRSSKQCNEWQFHYALLISGKIGPTFGSFLDLVLFSLESKPLSIRQDWKEKIDPELDREL